MSGRRRSALDKLYFWDPAIPRCTRSTPVTTSRRKRVKAGLPANTPVPRWATQGGFDPGAVLVAGTPEFRERESATAQQLPVRAAPRLGLPDQPENGGAHVRRQDVAADDREPEQLRKQQCERRPFRPGVRRLARLDGWRPDYISTWENPFPLSSCTTPTRGTSRRQPAELARPGRERWCRGELRMPREYNWTFRSPAGVGRAAWS